MGWAQFSVGAEIVVKDISEPEALNGDEESEVSRGSAPKRRRRSGTDSCLSVPMEGVAASHFVLWF